MRFLKGNGLGILAWIHIFFAGDLGMEDILRGVILEGVVVKDLTIGSGTIEWCLAVGEYGAEGEEPVFLADFDVWL